MSKQLVGTFCLLGLLTACTSPAAQTSPTGISFQMTNTVVPSPIAPIASGPEATKMALAQAVNDLFTQTAVAAIGAAQFAAANPSPVLPTATTDPDQDPASVAHLWMDSFFTSQATIVARYTCRAQAQNVSNTSMMTNLLLGSLNGLLGGAAQTNIDLSLVKYSVTQNAGATATVHMAGQINESVGGSFKTILINEDMIMAYEDGRWKYCSPSTP